MKLVDRLRAIAELIDLAEAAGHEGKVTPVDNNQTLEIYQATYNALLSDARARQILGKLEQSGGVSILYFGENGYGIDVGIEALFQEDE